MFFFIDLYREHFLIREWTLAGLSTARARGQTVYYFVQSVQTEEGSQKYSMKPNF
jgi:hypothetical protein